MPARVEVEEVNRTAGDVRDAKARLARRINPHGTHDGLSGGSSTSITRLFFRSISGHGRRPRYKVTHRAQGLTPRFSADWFTQAVSFMAHSF